MWVTILSLSLFDSTIMHAYQGDIHCEFMQICYGAQFSGNSLSVALSLWYTAVPTAQTTMPRMTKHAMLRLLNKAIFDGRCFGFSCVGRRAVPSQIILAQI